MTFHLAIPSHDLAESKAYYMKIGCNIGREYKTHIIINFWQNQLVCHLDPDACPKSPDMYPRHHGVILSRKQTFLSMYERMKKLGVVHIQMFDRSAGTIASHKSFFLKDPSNNMIEFKYYKYRRSVY